MQVSQLAELDSHAIIGGSKAQSFFLSDSAEFFTILSNTLYRDKKLAVVREVICNADDAHKMGDGCDLPVEIILNERELIIRDFGPGIADELMHGTYCGFGVSDKVLNKKVTGGFGLGCKAPFAYIDHFSVVSCHAGFKSVYAMSRGGVDTDGKPGMVKMVKAASQETGITVTIPMKESEDRHAFEVLIRRVVRQGGIKATLNGVLLDTYDMQALDQHGYGVVPYTQELNEANVFVRYGAVLYPLTTENKEISQLVKTFNHPEIRIIISAPAGSIGITPSREAISYSDQTIEVLKGLLSKTIVSLLSNKKAALRHLAEKTLASRTDFLVPNRFGKEDPWGYIRDEAYSECYEPVAVASTVIRAALGKRHYDYLKKFCPSDKETRRAIFHAAMRKHRDYRRSYRRMMNWHSTSNNRSIVTSKGYIPDLSKVLIRMVSKLDILKLVNVYGTVTTEDKHGNERNRVGVHPISRCRPQFYDKPKIVLVRGREQASGYCAALKGNDDRKVAFIVVRDLKPEKIQEIKDAAAKYGFAVEQLDISKPARKPKAAPKPVAEPVERKFHSLASVTNTYRMQLFKAQGFSITHAPYYLMGRLNDETTYWEIVGVLKDKVQFYREDILEIFPDVAVISTKTEEKALIAAGSKELGQAIADQIVALPKTIDTAKIVAWAYAELFKSNNKADHFANILLKSDIRYADCLLGEKTTNEQIRLHKLIRLIMRNGALGRIDGEPVATRHLNTIRHDKNLVLKAPDVRYLGSLAHLADSKTEVKYTEETVDLIRYLQRKHAAKSRTAATTQLMKDAA